MKIASAKKKNFIFGLAMGIMLLLQLLCLFYFGSRKAGFHEDELYTYYSTNKTAGLSVSDRQWMERDALRNDFVVLEGEQFRYGVVKQMQSWDVHPPFYYYIFHTVCSLFPGVFSKWLGIGINLIAYAVCYGLLAYGVYLAVSSRAEILSFVTCLAWGFSAAVISGVMFIRMYQWLTLFVLLCMDLHLRAWKKQDFGAKRFLLPLGITVFFGFLTQYYYIIFHFFMGAGFCFLLMRGKKWKGLFRYVLTCAAGLGLAICYYPASLSHIFRGYRGTEAVAEFGNASNTWERLRFFGGLFDDYVMNGTASVWLLLICIVAVSAGYFRKRKGVRGQLMNDAIGLLMFTCAGYFFTISKTALVLGETSNRYQLPIYGILLFLILYFIWTPVAELMEKKQIGNGAFGVLTAALVFGVAVMDGTALQNGKVFFLYEEEREVMEFAKEHRDEPVVVFYNEASSDNIWRLSDELMEYPKVYLASQGNPEPISDEIITESESLLVYVADYEDKEACLKGLLEVNKQVGGYKMIAEKGLWTLYELR